MKKLGFDNLFCTFCGERLERKADRCSNCGRSIGEEKYGNTIRFGAGGIGYSDKTDDPSFKSYKKKGTVTGAIILFIISIIIAVVLAVQGAEIILIGAVLGAIWLFDIIWFITSLIPKKDWEGTVEKKRTYRKMVKRSSDDNDYTYEDVYEIKFRMDDGKKKKQKDMRDSTLYNYVNIGDRVRFIGRLKYYEKYDKSKDASILCAGCHTMRDSRENYCGRCGCIILKH